MKKQIVLLIAFLPMFAMLTNCATGPEMSELQAERAELTRTTTGETDGSKLQCKETEEQLTRTQESLRKTELELKKMSTRYSSINEVNAGAAAAGTCYCCPSMNANDGNCSPHPCGFACPTDTIAASCGDGEVLIKLEGQFHCAPSGT